MTETTTSPIERDIKAEFDYDLKQLIVENERKFKQDTQRFIDFLTASLSYFTQNGISRAQIKREITLQVG